MNFFAFFTSWLGPRVATVNTDWKTAFLKAVGQLPPNFHVVGDVHVPKPFLY